MAIITDPDEIDKLMVAHLSTLPPNAIEKFCKDFNVHINSSIGQSSTNIPDGRSELIDIDEA